MRFFRWLLPPKAVRSDVGESPEPTICFGREDLRDIVIKGARRSGCVLLFGGRQSGKTTVLRAIEADLSGTPGGISSKEAIQFPVYIDLMQLPYDATPIEFFGLVSRLATRACVRHINGFKSTAVQRRNGGSHDLDTFRSEMLALKDAAKLDLHFIFLLDEAKRVLGTRFPRGFQDNLFALMFGGASGPYSFILVGAQELYRLCEDSTSPIGSRAAKQFVCNLSLSAMGEMIRCYQPEIGEQMLQERMNLIYFQSGGHAGLSAALARRFTDRPNVSVDGWPLSSSLSVAKDQSYFKCGRNDFAHFRVVPERELDRCRLRCGDLAAIISKRGACA